LALVMLIGIIDTINCKSMLCETIVAQIEIREAQMAMREVTR